MNFYEQFHKLQVKIISINFVRPLYYMLCQVPGFQNKQDLWAYQIYYKTHSFYLYQATLSSKRNYFVANMHYFIKIKQINKQKKEEILCLKGMQIGVILSEWEMPASFSHWQIYLPFHIHVLLKVPQGIHITQTLFSKLSVLPTHLFKFWISLYRTPNAS